MKWTFLIIAAAVFCVILIVSVIKFMSQHDKPDIDPTKEILKKIDEPREEIIEQNRYKSFLENHVEDGVVTLWIVKTAECLKPFYEYGENLKETQSYDDQRYHGFATYVIRLPQSAIAPFVSCLTKASLQLIFAQDKFVPHGEIRVDKK